MTELVFTRQTRVLMALTGASVAVLIISNLASTKITGFGPAIFDAGTILFPLAYVITGAITELYGPRVARWTVMIGIASLLVMSVVLMLVQYMPVGPGFDGQSAYERILGFVPRIALASMVAYFVGDNVNIRLMSWFRALFGSQRIMTRLIGSSGTGELIDTVTFSVVAFIGTMPARDFMQLIVTVYLIKLAFAAMLVPFMTRFISWAKQKTVASA